MEQILRYFKKIALIIILFVIAFTIITQISNINISRTFLKTFSKVSIIIAGYLFIIAKEKIEDEFIQTIRLRAIAFAFLTGIMVYIINQISGFNASQDAFFYFFNMMFMYIFIFYLTKFGVIKFEKQSKRNKRSE